MSNMASSVLGGSPGPNADVDKALHQLESLPSWEQIRATLHSKQTAEEQRFRQDLEMGYGIGSPLHRLRLFDASNKADDVRVIFYRDSASWCKFGGSWCADALLTFICSVLLSRPLLPKGLDHTRRKTDSLPCGEDQYAMLRRQASIVYEDAT